MSNEFEAPSVADSRSVLSVYQAPRLVAYGSLRNITAAATGSKLEAGSSSSTKRP